MFQLISKTRVAAAAAVMAAGAAVSLAFAAPAQAHEWGAAYRCTGGAISSGTYSSITVTGVCWIPQQDQAVVIRHNLVVAPGATLNGVAFSNGQLDLSHFNMTPIHVGGNVIVGRDAIMGLGCSIAMATDPFMPFPLCSPTQNSDVHIHGNLVAWAPRTMYLDGITIDRNLVTLGGGPGTDVSQNDAAFNFPIKDITVHGNLVAVGWRGGWEGIIRDQVDGNVVYAGNSGSDPDANEVLSNTIGRNLICYGNTPPAQYGDARFVPGAHPNMVGGQAIGQCSALTQPF